MICEWYEMAVLQAVTGVGKHSLNGRPKILPAVVRYLSDAGYRFSEAFGNSGVLDVFIGGQRRLLWPKFWTSDFETCQNFRSWQNGIQPYTALIVASFWCNDVASVADWCSWSGDARSVTIHRNVGLSNARISDELYILLNLVQEVMLGYLNYKRSCCL